MTRSSRLAPASPARPPLGSRTGWTAAQRCEREAVCRELSSNPQASAIVVGCSMSHV